MNGPQDLGGMMGFGPVHPEPNEPYFHAEWEKRALAITLGAAALGDWNLDMRTKVIHPQTHTRLPRYARGKLGIIDAVHGVFVFPDSNAHGCGEDPQWCYTVRFTGVELWGEDADPTLDVCVDCWEPYLRSINA